MVIFCGLFVLPVFSQNREQGRNNKEGIEKIFFGDFNAPVEFSYQPSSENGFIRPPSGFRIMKDTSNTSYTIEIKYISNYPEAHREASRKHPAIGLSAGESSSMSDARRNQIRDHNRAAFAKQHEEMLNLFKIESKSFTISNQYAEKMCEKMASFIDDFKDEGDYSSLIGGYRVVFRNVVDSEVRALNIHIPKDDALKWTTLCLQIIMDAQANQLDETKYINVLNTFKN